MAKRTGTETAQALIDAIGYPGTMALVKALGGKQIKIPSGRGPGSTSAWLDELLGVETARRLRAAFASEIVSVPKLTAQAKAARNRAIVHDFDRSVPMLEIVLKYDLTERQIRTILSQPAGDCELGRGAVDDRQSTLF